jgi:hypothetical protein
MGMTCQLVFGLHREFWESDTGMGTWAWIGKRIAPQQESSCFAWSLEFVIGIMLRSTALHEAMRLYSLLLHYTDCSSFHVQRAM